ncbi:MAG: hypothetical protein WCA08_03155 [Desulfoferrobacter sp.]
MHWSLTIFLLVFGIIVLGLVGIIVLHSMAEREERRGQAEVRKRRQIGRDVAGESEGESEIAK